MIATISNTLGQKFGRNPKELERFLKFVVVGSIGAIVDFGLLFILKDKLGWQTVPAFTVAFLAAVLSNFLFNRYWTYPDSRSKPITSQLGQFTLVNTVGWGINWGIVKLTEMFFNGLLEGIGWNFLLNSDGVGRGYLLAKLIATAIVLFWNFFVNRFWTYSDAE